MAETGYIHYGHKHFEPRKFETIRNRKFFNKPFGGLWASPVNAEFGWKEWNEQENFRCCKENSFKFRLKEGARVYHIYSKDNVEALPLQEYPFNEDNIIPDFEKIKELGYDAIEYHLSNQKPTEKWNDGLYYVLYGWDCDSILVLNKEAIVEI